MICQLLCIVDIYRTFFTFIDTAPACKAVHYWACHEIFSFYCLGTKRI